MERTYEFETRITVFSDDVRDVAEAMADAGLTRIPAVVEVDAIRVEYLVLKENGGVRDEGVEVYILD